MAEHYLDPPSLPGDLLIMMLPTSESAPLGWTPIDARYAWRISDGTETHFPHPVTRWCPLTDQRKTVQLELTMNEARQTLFDLKMRRDLYAKNRGLRDLDFEQRERVIRKLHQGIADADA